MANPFYLKFADDRRLVQTKIAPMVYRSDLFVRLGSEVTQLTRIHISSQFSWDKYLLEQFPFLPLEDGIRYKHLNGAQYVK